MSKLIIPAAELIGTPLTSEELKGILAGAIWGQSCSCHYYLAGEVDYEGNPIEHNLEAAVKDAAECDQLCASACDSDRVRRCESYNWTLEIYGGGPK